MLQKVKINPKSYINSFTVIFYTLHLTVLRLGTLYSCVVKKQPVILQ